MNFDELVLDLATKEHTPSFKRAVEQCKKQNPDKDSSYCFAAITSAFNKANKSIFLGAPTIDPFEQVLTGQSDQVFSEIALAEWTTYDSHGDFSEFDKVRGSLDDEINVELSGANRQWKSLGHALQVTEELIRPGVFTGIDGRSCRWTDTVLSKWHRSLLSTQVKMFHEKEGQIRTDLPVTVAGKVVGFVTHVTELAGRVFHKSLIFPKKAQEMVKSGKYRSSLEARVALSAPDSSGIHDIKAWLANGVAYTDNPAVRGKEGISTNPVAMASKNTPQGGIMPDPITGTDPAPPADPAPPTAPAVVPVVPAVVPDPVSNTGVTLSASDLQDIIKSAVSEATVELSAKVDKLNKHVAELTDVRSVARLAEISAMEADIKKHDEKFDFETLYAKDASLDEKESSLNLYVRGINKGLEIQQAQKPIPTITLAEDPSKEDLDATSLDLYGKTYDEMLAAPAGGKPGDDS